MPTLAREGPGVNDGPDPRPRWQREEGQSHNASNLLEGGAESAPEESQGAPREGPEGRVRPRVPTPCTEREVPERGKGVGLAVRLSRAETLRRPPYRHRPPPPPTRTSPPA